MSRHQRLLSQRQRTKQIDERNQANFREPYLDHITESAYIGVRHFANVNSSIFPSIQFHNMYHIIQQPIVLGRKRKRPKHDNLNSIISYLHHNNNNKKRHRPKSNISSIERRSKRRKLRHSIRQIRQNEDAQQRFYESTYYHNASSTQSYVIWQFKHQKFGLFCTSHPF